MQEQMCDDGMRMSGLPKRVAVVMSKNERGIAAEVSAAIANELSAMGVLAVQVADGDKEAFNCDTIIFAAEPRRFPRFAKILPTLDNRPRTVLWWMEPLPPSEAGIQWRKQGLSIAEYHYRLVKLFMPLGWPAVKLRRRTHTAEKLAKLFTSRKWNQLSNEFTQQTNLHWNEVTGKSMRLVFSTYHHLRKAIDDRWIDKLAVSTIANHDNLAIDGIGSTFAPAGLYEASGRRMNIKRDIDILFIGNARCPHRRELLQKLTSELKELSVEIKIVDQPCWGDERTKLFNRSKMVLHLHQYRWDTPWIRFVMANACGAMVIGEQMKNPKPFEPGVHYAEATQDDLAKYIRWYLDHPDEISAMAARAEQFITGHLTMRQSLTKILAVES